MARTTNWSRSEAPPDHDFGPRYLSNLQNYLAGVGTTGAILRLAASLGLETAQVIEVHHAALGRLLESDGTPETLAAAGRFLAEVLSGLDTHAAQARDALRQRSQQQELQAQDVSRGLLDGVAQPLFYAQLLLSEMSSARPEHSEKLAKAQQVLTQAGTQLGRLSRDLHPTILDDLGLVPALESLAKAVSDATSVPVLVRSAVEARLAPATEAVIFRAVEDTLHSTDLLARATAVVIRLAQGPAALTCSVLFLGVRRPRVGTLAVAGVEDRVTSAGGSVSLMTDSRRGTTLELSLPTEAAAAA